VLIWEPHSGDGFAEALSASPALRWVQLPSAGVEWLFDIDADIHRPGIAWTCAKGAYGDLVAELAVALLVAGFRQLHTFARARTWLPEQGRSLAGADVAIIGGGGIAAGVLRKLQPWDVSVTVVRRHPTPLVGARVVGVSELDAVLEEVDAVILAVPLTRQTRQMIGTEQLKRMRPGAWLVNVGRGGLIDTPALVEALAQDRLGGAALDVTDPEPLPDGHPLWSMPNVLITPHVATTLEMSAAPFAERIRDNLSRWRRGDPLVGVIDLDDQF
jgi:phosphoglycerate dehydrogenase-like enzyme